MTPRAVAGIVCGLAILYGMGVSDGMRRERNAEDRRQHVCLAELADYRAEELAHPFNDPLALQIPAALREVTEAAMPVITRPAITISSIGGYHDRDH